ncbi:MAG: BamA/TamA family outer membrane protein [Chloroherpetonaceae bacterium]|nr:BamA/TamA family outer membrane protein [Chloroherpetonaceae bacterium]MDW8437936.1 BamA/TamA family outer membrane protein [Chloroherpetonaceae bacterium]
MAFFVLSLSVAPLCAQVVAPSDQFSADKKRKPRYIDNLSIRGNKAISSMELFEEILTKPNASFFGIKPWLGIYRLGELIFPDSTSGAPEWTMSLKEWLQTSVGEPPAEFDEETFEMDLAKIREIYFNNGYFEAKVEGKITPSLPFIPEIAPDDTLFFNVEIQIAEGEPTRLSQIKYFGIEKLHDELREAILRDEILRKGDIYAVKQMVAERERIVNLMLANGYALFTPDSVRFIIDTLNHLADVNVLISPTEYLDFGKITAIVHDPFLPDSTAPFVETFEDSVRIRTYGAQRISHDVIRRSVSFRPGERTNIHKRRETIRRLGAMGIFESMTIRNDSIFAVEDNPTRRIGATIELTQLPPHQIKPELKIDNRNNAPFASISVGYLNRNLMGGAENFNLTGSIGLQLTYNREQFAGLRESRLIDELPFNFDIGAELTFPYFTSEKSRLIATTRYIVAQPPLLLRIQNVSFRLRAQYAPNEFQRINFDMIDLEVVSYDSARGARQLFINQNRSLDLLDSLVRDGTGFNQTIRFDFAFNNLTEARRWIDAKWNVLLEDAGLITGFIDRYIDTKPRRGFTDADAQIFGLRYFEYRKGFTQLAVAKFFNRFAQGAAKLQLGYMFPYGKAEETPFIRRFFAGGPNGIRAFPFNSLGPGNNSSLVEAQFGADIKIETSVEYRYFFFQTLGKPSGVALFIDAGNIWTRKGENSLSLGSLRRSFAVGAGYGVRIGTPIGPIRLDFAYRVFDPTQPAGRRWAYKRWRLGSFLFNFGIGEAF